MRTTKTKEKTRSDGGRCGGDKRRHWREKRRRRRVAGTSSDIASRAGERCVTDPSRPSDLRWEW